MIVQLLSAFDIDIAARHLLLPFLISIFGFLLNDSFAEEYLLISFSLFPFLLIRIAIFEITPLPTKFPLSYSTLGLFYFVSHLFFFESKCFYRLRLRVPIQLLQVALPPLEKLSTKIKKKFYYTKQRRRDEEDETIEKLVEAHLLFQIFSLPLRKLLVLFLCNFESGFEFFITQVLLLINLRNTKIEN